MDRQNRILRKDQALGTATSRIDLGRASATINSGYYSGNSRIDLGRSLGAFSEGTYRSYNANSGNINLAGKTRNLGAYSGDSKKPRGALDEGNKGSSQTPTSSSITNKAQHQDFTVIGTRRSFNLGSEHSTDKSFHKVRDWKERNENDNLWNDKSCGAGNTDKFNKDLLEKIENNRNHCKSYWCWGTEKSFNAKGPGKEIKIEAATLNTGAFAGIGTGQASTSRRSKSN